VLVLPLASVTVLLTVVSPIGKTDPEAGTELTVAIEQLSLAIGAE
jgi:hypothetical protein